MEADREVSIACLDMLRTHAVIKAGTPPVRPSKRRATAPAVAMTAGHEKRRQAAQAVLDAWKRFDQRRQAISGLAGNANVLAVFRMNDSTFTRAAWFVENPAADDVAPLAANLTNLNAAKVMRFSPPRVATRAQTRRL